MRRITRSPDARDPRRLGLARLNKFQWLAWIAWREAGVAGLLTGSTCLLWPVLSAAYFPALPALVPTVVALQKAAPASSAFSSSWDAPCLIFGADRREAEEDFHGAPRPMLTYNDYKTFPPGVEQAGVFSPGTLYPRYLPAHVSFYSWKIPAHDCSVVSADTRLFLVETASLVVSTDTTFRGPLFQKLWPRTQLFVSGGRIGEIILRSHFFSRTMAREQPCYDKE